MRGPLMLEPQCNDPAVVTALQCMNVAISTHFALHVAIIRFADQNSLQPVVFKNTDFGTSVDRRSNNL